MAEPIGLCMAEPIGLCMAEPIGLCSAQTQAKVDAIKKALGISIPDCSYVSATADGGLIATSTDANGTIRTLEVDKKGKTYFSSHCGDRVRGQTQVSHYFGVEGNAQIRWEPTCRDFNRVEQSGSVSLAKLAKAREMILGAKK
jgi:hypothetical protein